MIFFLNICDGSEFLHFSTNVHDMRMQNCNKYTFSTLCQFISICLCIFCYLFALDFRRVTMLVMKIYMMMLLQLHHLNHMNEMIRKMDRFHQLNVPMVMMPMVVILIWETHLHQIIQVGDINYTLAT